MTTGRRRAGAAVGEPAQVTAALEIAASGNGAAPAATPPSSRAIRVSLAPTMVVEGVAPMTVEPAPEPLVMLEASSGTGILGGFALDPERGVAPRDPAVLADGSPAPARLRRLDAEHVRLEYADGSRRAVQLIAHPQADHRPGGPSSGERWEVVVEGWRFEVDLESASRAALRERAHRGRSDAAHSGPAEVRAIIPGVVVGVSVAPGDEVVAGQQLLAVEAMKMQNELRAPRDGAIERVAVTVGQTIDVGDLLLVIS